MAEKEHLIAAGGPASDSGGRARALLHRHWQLLLLLPCFLLLALVYDRTFPPYEGPDEPQHFAYIQWLVEEGTLPPQGEAAWETPVEQEAGQPPFYYVVASLPARLVGFEPPAPYRPNPYFIGPFPRDNIDNDHRAIHYPGDARPPAGGWLSLYLARAVTLGFGLLLIAAIYLLGREVWPGSGVAPAAATLAAFTPQVLFLSTVISNDVPAAALSTLALWQLAVMLRRGPSLNRGIAAGLLVGLAVLTKVSAAGLLAPAAAGLIWLWLRADRAGDRRQVLVAAGGMALSAALVGGWWFLRNWALYGSPLGLGAHDFTTWAIRDPADLASPYLRWLEVFRSFWAGLGWGTVRPPGWVFNLLLILMILALVGLLLGLWRWLRRAERRVTRRVILLLMLTTLILATALFLESWMRRVSAPYGRLMFPALGAIAVLLAGGWHLLLRRLLWLPVGAVAALGIAVPLLVAPPYFTPPAPIEASAVAALKPGLGWRFLDAAGQPVAELLSFEPLLDEIATTEAYDQTLPVRICWRALARTEKPYTVFLHIIGPENALIANRRTYPGLGLRPTNLWSPGDVYCDLTRVLVRTENVPATLAYQLEVGLLDEETDARLQAVDQAGNPLPATFAGRVRLAAPDVQTTSLAEGEAIQLLDAQVEPSPWRAGGSHELVLQWGVREPVGADYQTFVHLRDEAGVNVAQADGPPLAGWYPTSWWRAGEVVTDARRVELPANLPAGQYTLVAGLYDLGSGQRFGEEHVLGVIEVQE